VQAERQNALTEIQRQESMVQDLNHELASIQVNQRIVALKLQNTEDQLKRERSLAETQSQPNGIGLETANQVMLDEQKSAFDAKYQTLLESIYDRFADFNEFESPVSEESVQVGLEKVTALIQSAKEGIEQLEEVRAELASVRGFLEVSDDAPIVPRHNQIL
jgi:hypothetical protein